jgi:hypothetical protein
VALARRAVASAEKQNSHGVTPMVSIIQRVWIAGYRWQKCLSTRVLTPVPSSSRNRKYDVRDHPGLFQTLAALDPEPDAIIAFANEYGELGGHEGCITVEEDGEPVGTLEFWESKIRAMKKAVTDGPLRNPEGVYKQFYARLVNEGLEGRVSIEYRFDNGIFVRDEVPKNLIGALWLQLAHALVGGKPVRCPSCGLWLSPTPIDEFSLRTKRRSDAKYCSDRLLAKPKACGTAFSA